MTRGAWQLSAELGVKVFTADTIADLRYTFKAYIPNAKEANNEKKEPSIDG